MRTRFPILALVLGAIALPLLAQDEPNPEAAAIEQAIEGLTTAQKQKIDADQSHYVKILADKWAAADPKQRKEILELSARNLRNKATEVRETTIEALSRMNGGPKDKDADHATRILEEETKKKSTEDDLTYFAHVLVAMGKLQRPNGVKVLTKMLKHKDNEVIAAAGEGLANFRGADFELRRLAVEEIIKIYSSADSAANDSRNTTAVDKLKKIKPSMDNALKSLSGHQAATALEWQRWWNNEGKKTKGWGEPAAGEKGG